MISYEKMLEHLGQTALQIDRKFFTLGQMGHWVYACDTGEYCWSSQIPRILGVSAHEDITPALLHDLIHPDDVERVEQALSHVRACQSFRVTFRLVWGKKVKWVEHYGRSYKGKQHAVPFVVGFVQDVSAMRKRQAEVDSQRADLVTMTSYLAETTDTTDLEAIVGSVKRIIRTRMDVAMIMVFVRQGERVYRVIPKGMDPSQGFLFQDIEDYVGYRAVLSENKQVCPIEEYPSAQGRDVLLALGAKSIVALPIKHRKQTIGALSISIKRPGELNAQEEEICRTICGHLSNQLKNALLYRELTEELARRERLESDREVIFNESVDFIIVQDHEGRLVQVNPAFAERLGHTVQGLIGQPLFDFIHPDERASARYMFAQMPSCGVRRGVRNRFICGDGKIGYLESNLKYMEKSGDTMFIARDMTNQREMEEQNIDLVRSIEAERLKREGLTGLSHEFKTPINIILSILDLIQMKSVRENAERFEKEYAKFFGYAYENCYKLLRLSVNLIDSSRMESGMFQLHTLTHDLATLLPEIVSSAEVYAAARGVSLSFQSLTMGALWALCDEDALDRIMLNLISNAIKNTPEGGKTRVLLCEEENQCKITVEDTGVGIAPEVLPLIFEKFQTAKPRLHGQQEGSGLGLSLVDTLVKLHGGSVYVESRVTEGSRFSVTLPKSTGRDGSESHQPQLAALEARAKMELSELR